MPTQHINLSVNVNKVALIRNARGGNLPDLVQVAKDCERFGADGITVHPRPDERHITYNDVRELKKVVTTEFNVEGNPTHTFMKLVLDVLPDQVTLVPDKPKALTSTEGWDTIREEKKLRGIIDTLKDSGIRVSVFVDPIASIIKGAVNVGADRVELYTGKYAALYGKDRIAAVEEFTNAALAARAVNIELNAGHDLNLKNLAFFAQNVPFLKEVSIGHALISDALYYGLENTIQMYKRQLVLTENDKY